ncbi:MAG TPA: cupin domain-containing protein [Anaerolineales bacterium]|nr:cupin domain-containing protein [Anaerolineales bacterium]
MNKIQITPESGFRVLSSTSRSQVATMVIPPGGSTGGPNNKHAASDQWLYVLSGEGEATVNGKEIRFHPGTLLLIESGETHEIRNLGNEPLETLNIYAPPAY